MPIDDKIKEFLEGVATLKNVEYSNSEANLFEIAGFPRYENVVSNILAFFLNPEGEHNMSDLWISSLLDCYAHKNNKSLIPCGNVIDIEREYVTKNKKRIDLLIETDSYVIVIENKIDSTPYNPFAQYHKTAEEVAKNEKEIIEILLTVHKEEKKYRFVNITYQEYLNKIENKLGNYILNIDTKWITFMREFICNLEQLYRSNDMDNYVEWNTYINDNENYIKLFNLYKADIDGKKRWLEDVKKSIKEEYASGIYGKSGYIGCMSIFMDFKCAEEGTYVLEAYIPKEPVEGELRDYRNPSCFYICIWNRTNKKWSYNRIKSILGKDYSEAEKFSNAGWGNTLLLNKLSFTEDIKPESVAEKLNNIAETLKDNLK